MESRCGPRKSLRDPSTTSPLPANTFSRQRHSPWMIASVWAGLCMTAEDLEVPGQRMRRVSAPQDRDTARVGALKPLDRRPVVLKSRHPWNHPCGYLFLGGHRCCKRSRSHTSQKDGRGYGSLTHRPESANRRGGRDENGPIDICRPAACGG